MVIHIMVIGFGSSSIKMRYAGNELLQIIHLTNLEIYLRVEAKTS